MRQAKEFVPLAVRRIPRRMVTAVDQAAMRRTPAREWSRRQYAMPAPYEAKWGVLHRYGDPLGVWVETGTFLGTTTAHLAEDALHVYSIEPQGDLAREARARFAKQANVTIIEGTSEERLAPLVANLTGSVNFWLDGHYSAGRTYRGVEDTPIRAELSVISRELPRLSNATVLVDDVRCFDPTDPDFTGYPSRSWLVHWAEENDLTWTIEHDIFAAWKMHKAR